MSDAIATLWQQRKGNNVAVPHQASRWENIDLTVICSSDTARKAITDVRSEKSFKCASLPLSAWELAALEETNVKKNVNELLPALVFS